MYESKRRTEIVRFIKKFMLENNYPPSTREIGEAVGLSSTSTVNHHLNMLREHGIINFKDDTPRSITVKGVHYIDAEA